MGHYSDSDRRLFQKRINNLPNQVRFDYSCYLIFFFDLLHLIQYDENNFFAAQSKEVKEIIGKIDNTRINWIDVEMIEDERVVEELANCFTLHPMLVDDILTQEHLPKLEVFDNHLFVTLRMLFLKNNDTEIEEEQLSIVLGDNYVLSFQSGVEGDVFDTVRERLGAGKANFKNLKADYLFYHLIDSVVDEYLKILEKLRDNMETLEDHILTQRQPDEAIVNKILLLRKQVSFVRKFTVPLKDIISKLKTVPPRFIQSTTITYLQDISDQLFMLNTNFDTFREMLKDLMELYLANLSHNMNNVMKTLTIVATIFIPLTFLAGIYGMNFDNMPELHWRYGYFMVWGIMIVLGVGMLWYMNRKHWY